MMATKAMIKIISTFVVKTKWFNPLKYLATIVLVFMVIFASVAAFIKTFLTWQGFGMWLLGVVIGIIIMYFTYDYIQDIFDKVQNIFT